MTHRNMTKLTTVEGRVEHERNWTQSDRCSQGKPTGFVSWTWSSKSYYASIVFPFSSWHRLYLLFLFSFRVTMSAVTEWNVNSHFVFSRCSPSFPCLGTVFPHHILHNIIYLEIICLLLITCRVSVLINYWLVSLCHCVSVNCSACPQAVISIHRDGYLFLVR